MINIIKCSASKITHKICKCMCGNKHKYICFSVYAEKCTGGVKSFINFATNKSLNRSSRACNTVLLYSVNDIGWLKISSCNIVPSKCVHPE